MKTRLEGEEQRQGHRALAGRPFANLGESAWWVGLEEAGDWRRGGGSQQQCS